MLLKGGRIVWYGIRANFALVKGLVIPVSFDAHVVLLLQVQKETAPVPSHKGAVGNTTEVRGPLLPGGCW